MKQLLVSLISITSLLVAISSCRNDDGPFNDQAALYDIVTFEGNKTAGAVFSFQRYDDSPLITLTAPKTEIPLSTAKIGNRVILGYYPHSGKPYQTDNISVLSVSRINQDTLRIANPSELTGWDTTPVWLNSIWRSGKWINVYMRVDYSNEARVFNLSADSTTLDEPFIDLYLMHDLLDAPQKFSRRAYISVDISNVWQRPTCHGVRIFVNDKNRPQKATYSFSK